ncbi:MAG: hypothetical protein SNH27_14935 [Rikenellaceae bacterium]
MAQEQNYSVNYSINVEATQGTKQVQAFADAVGKLVQAKNSFTPAITNIKKMMDEIDKTFRTKSGKKRDYTFTLSINTDKSEEKLNRIKGLLSEIKTLASGINVTVNAGQALETNKIRANAKALRDKRVADKRNTGIKQSAAESVNSMMSAQPTTNRAQSSSLELPRCEGGRRSQKSITKVIGKINSAMTHLEKGREINIKTETAEERIRRLLALMGQLKGASTFSVVTFTYNDI